MRILVVNAGSSSLKLAVLDDDDHLVDAETVAAPNGQLDEKRIRLAIERHAPFDAVGHRIVHGGSEFLGPARLSPAVMQRLWALADLAPLHQPKSLHAVDSVSRIL